MKKEIVNSIQFRELTDSISGQVSHNFKNIKEITGSVRLLNDCVMLLNDLWVETEESDTMIIDIDSDAIYPDNIQPEQKITRDARFRIFYSGVLDRKTAFVDQHDQINPNINIRSYSDSINYSGVNRLIKNSDQNILTNKVPFMVKYINQIEQSELDSDLIIEINTENTPTLINAIQYSPIPPDKLICINEIKINNEEIKLNGDQTFPTIISSRSDRMKKAYFHFNNTIAKNIKIRLTTSKYLSNFGGNIIALSGLVFENIIYSTESCIGYKIAFPEGNNNLWRIRVKAGTYIEYPKNFNIRFYSDEAAFKNAEINPNIADSEIIGSIDNFGKEWQELNIQKPIDEDDIYMLLYLGSTNNVTTIIENLELEFNNE